MRSSTPRTARRGGPQIRYAVNTHQHGDPTYGKHRRYYRLVQERAQAGLARGETPLQIAPDTDLDEFAERADAERMALDLHRARVDLEGGEVDIMAACQDAVVHDGGLFHTSV